MSCPAVIDVILPGPPGPGGGSITLTGPAVLGREDATPGTATGLPLGQGLSIVNGALTAVGATDLSYDPATRLLSSSTGADVTLPLVTTTAAGLIPYTWLTGAEAATLPHIHGALAGPVYEHVRNVSGAVMPALTPYHVVGGQGDTDHVQIVPADAGDPQTMPASGILLTELANNEDGHGAIAGVPTGVDTGANPSGTVLYVGSGVLTPTPPAANVQALAIVGRSHATTGTLVMLPGPALARVAFTGDYGDLGGRPTLGTAAALSVGTAAGTVAAGDDSRFSDAREWTAATVDQGEAEAGVGTTRRAWTAQRVRQAVAGWWTATSTAAGRALVTAADAAAQRTALGLGDSATRNVGTAAGTVAAGDAPAIVLASHLADPDPHPVYLKSAEILAGTNVTLDKTTTPGSVIINAGGGGGTPDMYAVGNYIMPVDAAVAAGISLGANTIYLYPFFLRRSAQIGELGARVTASSAGSAFQLAIYETATGLPGAVLASTADISGASATALSSSVTPVWLQADRVYWFGVNINTTGLIFQAPIVGSAYANSIIGADSLSIVSSGASGVVWNRAFMHAYGTWPDLTGHTTSLVASSRAPSPILRISALL